MKKFRCLETKKKDFWKRKRKGEDVTRSLIGSRIYLETVAKGGYWLAASRGYLREVAARRASVFDPEKPFRLHVERCDLKSRYVCLR